MAERSPNVLQQLKEKTRGLRREVYAMYLAMRRPETPWYAKALAAGVVLYALSPVDLIPDPIPVLGYLDDVVVVPLGVLLVRRWIPPEVLEECRKQAEAGIAIRPIWRWLGAVLIGAIWLACAGTLGVWLWRLLHR